jgi:hypothetical protein
LRLITSSNLVGACTGRSAGFETDRAESEIRGGVDDLSGPPAAAFGPTNRSGKTPTLDQTGRSRLHLVVRQTRRAARIDSNVKSTEQVTKRVLNRAASRGIRSPCAELAAQYSHSTPTPTAVRPSPPASP